MSLFVTSLRRRCGSIAAATATVLLLAANSEAGERLNGWRLLPELRVTGIMNFAYRGGASDSFDTVALTGELTFLSGTRRYRGGPFVDYRYSSSDQFDRNLNLGVYGRFDWSRWDATGSLFRNRARNGSATWLYAARLRFLVFDGHKLGIVALAPLEHAGRPKLMLGYYRSLHESWVMNVFAGTTAGRPSDVAARIEIGLRLH
jgi:hypothetical protein